MNSDKVLPVDFNNRDEDGAVRLVTRGTIEFLEEHGIDFAVGEKVRMTDGEIVAEGTLVDQDGMWTARIDRWIDNRSS